MAPRRVNVVQIGIGHDHAELVLRSLYRQPDQFAVLALAVPPCEEVLYAERIRRCREDLGVRILSVEEALCLPDLDGAIIETEEKNLTAYAQLAADKGLHVHMDKPSGFRHEDFIQLIETLKEKRLVFTTGYMYRFNPVIIDALQKVERGDIGKVYAVEAHMGGEHPKAKRQWLEQFPGGMTFFLGCHLIDLIFRIQGEPENVIPLNCSTGKEGVTADDYGMAVLQYPNGVSFAKACVAEPGGFMRRQLVICGEKGTIEIRPLEINYFHEHWVEGDQLTKIRQVEQGNGWNADQDFETSPMYNRYDDMMKNFAQIIRGEKENAYSYDYELQLNRLVMRCCGETV